MCPPSHFKGVSLRCIRTLSFLNTFKGTNCLNYKPLTHTGASCLVLYLPSAGGAARALPALLRGAPFGGQWYPLAPLPAAARRPNREPAGGRKLGRAPLSRLKGLNVHAYVCMRVCARVWAFRGTVAEVKCVTCPKYATGSIVIRVPGGKDTFCVTWVGLARPGSIFFAEKKCF